MTWPDLERLVREADPTELPALAGRLREAELLAEMRLRDGTRDTAATTPRDKWIAPDAAAEIAGVPVKRIYEWARGQKWASRPTRRCLRINEAEFLAWLKRR